MNDITEYHKNDYLENKNIFPKNTTKTKKYANEIFEKNMKKYDFFENFEFSKFHISKLENFIFSTLSKKSSGKS